MLIAALARALLGTKVVEMSGRVWALVVPALMLLGACAYGVEDTAITQPSGPSQASSAVASTVGAGGSAQASSSSGSQTDQGGAGGQSPVDPTPYCGDGFIDAGEECDDGNADGQDGCTSCQVDCDAGEYKNPQTNHCYRLVHQKAHWMAAESDCIVWGGAPGLGHLVSIGSKEEQTFVANLGSGHDRWIGGNDEVQEGNYVWSDGSSFSYENWRSGEPNNDGHGSDPENCAEIEDDGRWDDQPCDKTKRYICERRAAGSP